MAPAGVEGDDEDECLVFKRRPLRFLSCVVLDRPVLNSGVGDRMVYKLGLSHFMNTPLPEMDEKLCTDFIRSFSRKARLGKGCGMVNGHKILLCSHSVHKVTGLPLGELRDGPVSTKETVPILREMFPCLKRSRGEQGYYLPRLSRRVDNTEQFMALALTLNEKIMCSDPQHNNVSEVVLLGLHFSLQEGNLWPWAGLLAKEMVDAVQMSRQRSGPFVFGNWLSGIIRSQLPSPPTDTISVAASTTRKEKAVAEEQPTPTTKGKEKKQIPEVSMVDTIPTQLEFSRIEDVISGLIGSEGTSKSSGREAAKVSGPTGSKMETSTVAGRRASKVSGHEGSKSSQRETVEASEAAAGCGTSKVSGREGSRSSRREAVAAAGRASKVSRREVSEVAGRGSSKVSGREAVDASEVAREVFEASDKVERPPEGEHPASKVSGEAAETAIAPGHGGGEPESMDIEESPQGERPVSGEAVEASEEAGRETPVSKIPGTKKTSPVSEVVETLKSTEPAGDEAVETPTFRTSGCGNLDGRLENVEASNAPPAVEASMFRAPGSDDQDTEKACPELETAPNVSDHVGRETMEISTDSGHEGVKSSKASGGEATTTVEARETKKTQASQELYPSLPVEEPESGVHVESGRKKEHSSSVRMEVDDHTPSEKNEKKEEDERMEPGAAADAIKKPVQPSPPVHVTLNGCMVARQLRHLREELADEKRRRVIATLEHGQMLADLDKLKRRLMQRVSEEQKMVDPVLEELQEIHKKQLAADEKLYREKKKLGGKARLLAEFLSAFNDLKLFPKCWLGRTLEHYVEYKNKIEQLKSELFVAT